MPPARPTLRNALAPGRTQLPELRTTYACGLAALSTDIADVERFVLNIAAEAARMEAGFALIYFSRSLFNAIDLAAMLAKHAPALPHAGCSTAGEITANGLQDGHALALLFPKSGFVAVGAMIADITSLGMSNISAQISGLRRQLAQASSAANDDNTFAICLIDGLSNAEEAVTAAIHLELDEVPLIGGSSGDDMKFEATDLLLNGRVASDAAVVVLFSTDTPFRIFKTDNFVATDEKLVVTSSDPARRTVNEFNAAPAAEEYTEAIHMLRQDLSPLSYASHPTVVRVGGEYFCRSIQKANRDGSLSFFCAIDDGVVLSIAHAVDLVESTQEALSKIDRDLGGADVILGFDCTLSRLDAVNRQILRPLSDVYRANNVIGFGTYGEQYRSMHLNQTFTGIAFGRTPVGA